MNNHQKYIDAFARCSYDDSKNAWKYVSLAMIVTPNELVVWRRTWGWWRAGEGKCWKVERVYARCWKNKMVHERRWKECWVKRCEDSECGSANLGQVLRVMTLRVNRKLWISWCRGGWYSFYLNRCFYFTFKHTGKIIFCLLNIVKF